MRLLLCNVHETPDGPVFKKAELVRMPVRLGEDSFRSGIISEEKKIQLAKSMKAYSLLMDVFGVISYRACATAAMREAVNAEEVVKYVKDYSGINIEVVDGGTEAEIIYSNHIAEEMVPGAAYLYIDVGGGSTEITLFADRHIVSSQSFNVGTIRLLHENVSRETWNSMKEWVQKQTKPYGFLTGIGSGGNINKLSKMILRKENRPVTVDKLRELYDYLKLFTVEELITKFGLNPDRADVIRPAAKIFLTVMKAAGITSIMVPQVGLSDGIIHLLYEKHKSVSVPG